MSATNPKKIIEHIVLFKVKPDINPSKPPTMVNILSSLTSLDTILHLTAGPLHRCQPSSLNFAHTLHTRYSSKDDLNDFSDHAAHVAVVNEYVKPIVEDVMAVDWVSSTGLVTLPPGYAMRVTFLKLKESSLGEKEKDEVLGVIGEIKRRFQRLSS